MKSQTSSKFSQIRQPTVELADLEHVKTIPIGIQWEKGCLHFFRLFMIQSLLFLQVMMTCIKAWMSSNLVKI